MGPASASGIEAKLIKKAQNFLRSLEQRVDIYSPLNKRNSSYDASLTRSTKDAPADIVARDKQWRAWKKGGASQPFIEEVTKGACASAVQLMKARKTFVTEVIIVDKLGANVCVAPASSDYDQGDEAKFQAPFNQGKNPHVGDIEVDKSTGEKQAQISILLEKNGNKVGVVTIGVRSK
jgi:hypothetical protein